MSEQFTRLHSSICFFTEKNRFLHDELAFSLAQIAIPLITRVESVLQMHAQYEAIVSTGKQLVAAMPFLLLMLHLVCIYLPTPFFLWSQRGGWDKVAYTL